MKNRSWVTPQLLISIFLLYPVNAVFVNTSDIVHFLLKRFLAFLDLGEFFVFFILPRGEFTDLRDRLLLGWNRITFRKGEQAVFVRYTVESFYILLDLFCEEVRDLYHPVTLGSLRRCDHILPVKSLIRFVYRYRFVLKIEILRCKSEKLALTHTGPVKKFESVEGHRLVHHSLGEPLILIRCPEEHLAAFFFSHVSCDTRWIIPQSVVLDRVIEDRT